MKIGDMVRCTHSADNDFTVGKLYIIDAFDGDGDPILVDNDGYIGNIGVIMNGYLYQFEEVK
ncbi:hypothetical protein vBKpMFBKp34_202 [Klebsiella phage vB_KpM_FBKp34]|nr:hypothetical protein vBKpMFBKp34_202 [Klebsiella phage vB_KpM_FBKp34]